MGKGETEEVRGRKSEARGIDKNARPTQFGSRAYFERSPNSVSNSCHLFFAHPIVRQFALLLSSSRVVRLNTRGETILELVQRSSEPQLIRGRGPGS